MKRSFTFGALIALAITGVACGDSSSDSDASPSSAVVDTTVASTTPPDTATDTVAPDSVAPDTVVVVPATLDPNTIPTKIVSLSPTHTEILFAIGAGDQVIAIDDQSNYPPEAAALPNDLSGFEPNVEAIAAYEPDLVVLADDFNGLVDQLSALGIPAWSGPAAATFDDMYAQIEQLGAVTGHVAEAAEVVLGIQTDLDAIVASAPDLPKGITYMHEVDSTLYVATSATFIGKVYELFGLTNIADAADDGSGYPQLSAEFIIEADPDFIFLGDALYGESPETVAARPGWASLAAVANGGVIPVDADTSSRWGPRVVDFAASIADALNSVIIGV
jgi:iron complex transport system substrate-binding protein